MQSQAGALGSGPSASAAALPNAGNLIAATLLDEDPNAVTEPLQVDFDRVQRSSEFPGFDYTATTLVDLTGEVQQSSAPQSVLKVV